MTPRQIAAMLIRLLAVWTVIQAFGYIDVLIANYFNFELNSGFPSPIGNTYSWREFMSLFLPFTLQASVGVFVWMLADALAIYVAPESEKIDVAAVEMPPVVVGGLLLLGVWLVAISLPVLVNDFVRWGFTKLFDPMRETPSFPFVIKNLVQLTLGLLLTFRVRGLARIIISVHPMIWLRNVGRDEEFRDDNDSASAAV